MCASCLISDSLSLVASLATEAQTRPPGSRSRRTCASRLCGNFFAYLWEFSVLHRGLCRGSVRCSAKKTRRRMNPPCARCGKIVYPTEKVSCLDKVLTLRLKNLRTSSFKMENGNYRIFYQFCAHVSQDNINSYSY